tara:strand:- start:196 stop:420 length:225 start_codon:yes stop_codon:yes gene_type:complete
MQLSEVAKRLEIHKGLIKDQTPRENTMFSLPKEELEKTLTLMAYSEGEHGFDMRLDDDIEKKQNLVSRIQKTGA